jgi:ribonuclease J
MSQNGFANVVVAINKDKNEIVGRTRIISRGTLYVRNAMDLMKEAQKMVHGAILYTIKNKPN